METMTKKHPRWQEFIDRLESKEGCWFHENEKGEGSWFCSSEKDRIHARKILYDMNLKLEGDDRIDVAASFEYFNEHGGYCDCEILFNVAG